ncbi:MAG: Cyclohexadienyl dehydratase [Alphaproteobacteria bacterium MarineAlpha5_Bin9]|nr:MAG: Cyclohexadienyl dehydratase [Alphaproteobacteria bacterium MarineAlpha5_Bin9]|tara:strand:+ start:21329 stop:22105 length:777 start_codon:yes stop_codon:yes gene_type:complete
MKYITCFISLFFLIISSTLNAESRLKSILENGELRVGTTGDWNPMTYKDPSTNEYMGFDIEIARELAKDMGVEIKFIPTEWKTLVTGILANKYDISTSASLSEKRALTTGYTNSFFKLATVPLTLKKNSSQYVDWQDINNSSVTVAVTLGTVQEQYAKILFPNAKLKVIESPARDFQEVLAERADVHLTSNIEAAALVEKYPELYIVPVKEPKFPTPLAWLVSQEDQILINYINHWIKIKKSRGYFDEMMNKWNLKSL